MAIREYQPERLENIKAAIIGAAGRGKTYLAKTLKEPTVLIAAEPGALVIRDEIMSGQIKALEVQSLQDIYDVYAWVKDQKDYRHLYFDSMTEISDIVLKDLEPKFKDGRQLYGEFAKIMVKMIKAFRDLPQYSVWFTCLETVEMDEFNRRYVAPNVAGKMLKEKFSSLFDLVLYYDIQINPETGDQSRVLVTGNYKTYPGKDRSGKLDIFMPPDLSVIKDRIINTETQPVAA